MALRQFTGEFLQEATNQNGIAVANLPWLWYLSWRNNFIAGRKMEDAQARAYQGLGAADRSQQGHHPGVEVGTRPQNRLTNAHFFAALTNIRCVITPGDFDFIAGSPNIFLHDDPQVFTWQSGTC